MKQAVLIFVLIRPRPVVKVFNCMNSVRLIRVLLFILDTRLVIEYVEAPFNTKKLLTISDINMKNHFDISDAI